MKLEEVSKVLCEYGEAIRGDWGSIDGRSERSTIHEFAAAILAPGSYTIDDLRSQSDICPNGYGHWTQYCDEGCA